MNNINRVSFSLAGFFLLFIALQPIEVHTYSRTIIDDGYYYLNYALNVAGGAGPTFDGLVQTNGVQPLWVLLLLPLALVFSDAVSMLYAALVLSAVLALLSVFFINAALEKLLTAPARTVALLFYILFVANPSMMLTGMELNANLAALTLALAAVLRLRRLEPLRLSGVGLLIALTVMARIDNLIVAPVFVLLLLWQTGIMGQALKTRQFGTALRVIVLVMLPVTVVFAGYLAFNMLVFERPMPISGDIKATREGLRLAAQGGRFTLSHLWATTLSALNHYAILLNNFLAMMLASFGPAALLARLVFIALLVGTFTLVIVRRQQSRRTGLQGGGGAVTSVSFDQSAQLTLILAVLLVFAHTWLIFFQLGRAWAVPLPWYYGPEYILLSILIGCGLALLGHLAKVGQRFYLFLFCVLLGMGIFGGLVFYAELMHPPVVRPLNTLYQAAQWANEHLPQEAVIGSFNSGIVGYFTHASVINLDGLMNNEEILRVVRGEDTIEAYVDRQQITHIMEYESVTWSMETAAHFRGIPLAQLELLYEQPFMDWEFVPSVYYIFRVMR